MLQEREFERVGGTHPVPIDVRVLAATNCDLRAAVAAGKFRADLYYRLNVFPIHMPALRDRMDDIPSIVEHLIARCSAKIGKNVRRVDEDSLERLVTYDWPGNIRELQNVLERAVILCEGETARIEEEWLDSGEAISSPCLLYTSQPIPTSFDIRRDIADKSRFHCAGQPGFYMAWNAVWTLPLRRLHVQAFRS